MWRSCWSRALRSSCNVSESRLPSIEKLFYTASSTRVATNTLLPQLTYRIFHTSRARGKETPATSNTTPDIQDHRELALKSDLWTLHPSSPGAPMFLPAGTHIFMKLIEYLRYRLQAQEFQEVLTPTMYKQSLWIQSGHWDNYKDDMFTVGGSPKDEQHSSPDLRGFEGDEHSSNRLKDSDGEDYGLKPMNCPGHCVLYQAKRRTYRELPIRYSEFSPLHRNENSGSLSGLTRVRRFHQDDGHIFCRFDQVTAEVQQQLNYMRETYERFGLKIKRVYLSTPPKDSIKGFLGSRDEWAPAIEMLRTALEQEGLEYRENPGEAAFYGPKIDVTVEDCNGKEHQTATIQLDFQLPKRFDLTYDRSPHDPTVHIHSKALDEGNKEVAKAMLKEKALDDQSTGKGRPVMIHRAMYGSLERFMALLAEHYKRSWPFWLSPKQVLVLTVTNDPKIVQHGEEIVRILRNARGQARGQTFNVDLDATGETVQKKIAKAKTIEGIRYNVIIVIGAKDIVEQTISADISAQPDQDGSYEIIKQIKPESVAPVQNKSQPTGPANKGSRTIKMSPHEFVEVMKKWDEQYL